MATLHVRFTTAQRLAGVAAAFARKNELRLAIDDLDVVALVDAALDAIERNPRPRRCVVCGTGLINPYANWCTEACRQADEGLDLSDRDEQWDIDGVDEKPTRRQLEVRAACGDDEAWQMLDAMAEARS